MTKRIMATLVCIVTALILTGCKAESVNVNVNVENDSTISGTVFGKSALIEISDGLYYDTTTRIVYWWNGILERSHFSTTPSPYYAPNGLPYRYNPESNMFERIADEHQQDVE